MHTCSFPLPCEDSISSHRSNILGRANGRCRGHPEMELVNAPKARQLQLKSRLSWYPHQDSNPTRKTGRGGWRRCMCRKHR